MHYSNKPHFKIFSSTVLGLLQYFLLNHNFEITHDYRDEIIAFSILTLNSLVTAVVISSTVYDVRKQIKTKISNEVTLLQKEIRLAEDEIEKFEHVILDEATLLLGSKVYRTNPILNQFE